MQRALTAAPVRIRATLPSRPLRHLGPAELGHSDKLKMRDGEGTGRLDSEAAVTGH